MAYQYESFQSSLPASVPAGWNDPPPISGHPNGGTTSRLSQLRRRPVDPSITGPSYGMGGHHQGYGAHAAPAPYGAPSAAPAGNYGAPNQQHVPQGQQHVPQGHQHVPQGHQQAPQGYPGYPMANQPQPDAYGSMNLHQSSQPYPPSQVPGQTPNQMSINRANPFVPTSSESTPAPNPDQQGMQQYNMPPPAATSAPYAQQPSPVISQQPGAATQGVPPQQQQQYQNIAPYYQDQPMVSAPSQAASMPSAQPRQIYNAFTVNPDAQGLKTDPFVVRPQSSAPFVSVPPVASHAAWTTTQNPVPPQQPPATPPVLTQPLESNPQSLIFAPPGSVGEPYSGYPGVALSAPVDANRMPQKAAGDVSLSGSQLVVFLMKATTKLPQTKCEGVQLRLNQLNDFVHQGKLSEPCIKKLNFVVDAIDRELYNDASLHFEQLNENFPQEMGTWGQGVRILIGELKGPNSRVSSAGPHVRSH